jgi:large subunit ribosomal protein L23
MNQERVFNVLLGPHVSEKTAIATETSNQYTFRVAPDANKLEIRRAVEKLFKVKVASVRVLNVKGKVKTNRFGAARRSDWKKAYVRLETGHDIDFTVTD